MPGVVAGSAPSALTNAALLRDRGFLAISAAFALGLFAQVGLFAHLVTRLAPVVDADGAALTVSLVTVCAVLGRSLFQRLLRDDNRRQVAALNFLVQAAGTTVLTLASSMPAVVSGCLLFGLGVGNLVSLPPLIMQKEFAAGDVGKAVALMVAITTAVLGLRAGAARHRPRHRERVFLVVGAWPLRSSSPRPGSFSSAELEAHYRARMKADIGCACVDKEVLS
jgi:predicted MFS family arabinose efflux permease